jgi:acyl carrier protein phosphodiesterase
MNYLAHLFLAQTTEDSHFGNLLGDFRRGVEVSQFSAAVQRGLANHYGVDKFTDAHDSVKKAQALFLPSRRRFAPVALDIYFDHLLIKHWSQFSSETFEAFTQRSFALLEGKLPQMPRTMQHSIGHMITHNWFEDYATEKGIEKAITVVSKRIRFKNNFYQAVDDIDANREDIETLFLNFFPELQQHINLNGPEAYEGG